MSCQNQEIELIKARVKLKYEWIDDETINSCYDMAMNDYLMLRYPVENDRPVPEKVVITKSISVWLQTRIMDILSRAGINLSSYKENNLNLIYGGSYIDPVLASMIKPKASVPK